MKDLMKNMGILRPFFRGLPIIILVMLLSVLTAKRYLRYTTPMYESTAKIKLADNREGLPNSNLYKDFDLFATNNKIAAEVELLKSKTLINKAVESLGISITSYRVGDLHQSELYHQSPFTIQAAIGNPKLYDRSFQMTISNDSVLTVTTPDGQILNGVFGKDIVWKGGLLRIGKNDALLANRKDLKVNDRYAFTCHSQESLTESIIGNLDVMSVDKEVPVLRISYKSAVPEKSADIVNAISAAYLADYINEKFKSADTTVDFLSKQLGTMSGRLSASENAIEGYRNKENIINIRQETETDLRKIADLKKQLASVQMNLLAIKDLNGYLEAGKEEFEDLAPNFEAFTDLLSTEMVKKMKDLQRERRDLLLKYAPENEKVKVVDAKIGDITHYLQESVHNTERNLQIKYNDLKQTISEAEEVFVGLPDKERTMTILERNFSLNEQIYRFLHEKRTEAEIARAATISFHRVISEGEVPRRPVSPNATLITVFAGFLGFVFGIIGIYLVHFVKARINDASIIHKSSETPLLAEVPFMSASVEIAAWFKRWATELSLKGMASNGAVIAVSSFDEQEGKTFNALGLMPGMQAIGKKCVLIDVDNAVSEVAGIEVIHASQLPMHWSIQENWQTYLHTLQQQFDVIIIRNFPVTKEPASLMLMANATTNLFLFDSRLTRQKMIMQADLMKEDLKLPNMFYVLNRAGYTPNVLVHGFVAVRTCIQRLRRSK